ncbi:MAG TPA: hypothetical protein VF601_08995 [Beijerinckiaceae bacterium]
MPVKIDPDREEDLRAEARSNMFLTLRHAVKERCVPAKDIVEATGKDKGYVSRVLNGTHSIDFETFYVFLEALGYALPLNPVKIEDLCKANFDARTPRAVQNAQTRSLPIVIRGITDLANTMPRIPGGTVLRLHETTTP